MSEDSSLTEFIETDNDQSPSSQDDQGRESTDADDDTVTVTFAWSDDGGRCAECGGTVARRWTDEGRLVCADCKGW